MGAFHIMNEKGWGGLTYCSPGLCMGVDVLFCGVAGSLNSRSCFIVQFVIGMVVYGSMFFFSLATFFVFSLATLRIFHLFLPFPFFFD